MQAKPETSISIHPRVESGRTRHVKVNTCAPHNARPGKILRKRMKALEIRRHDRDLSCDRLRHKNPAIDWQKAMRKPGRMK